MMAMRKVAIFFIVFFFALSCPGFAFWIWTPQSNRWENPKYSVKDSPQEQLEIAQEFLQSENYKDAMREFRKLIKHYSKSFEAPLAQFGIAECYEAMGQPYKAFQEYQKVIEKYPFSDLGPQIVERQYLIGEQLLEHPEQSKFVRTFMGSEYDVVDIFRTVIKNAPYGPLAAVSQYKIGLYLFEKEMFQEARDEFVKVVYDYSNSEWVKPAKYHIALVDTARSAEPGYDQKITQAAVRQFEQFVDTYPDAKLTQEAQEEILQLQEKEAESSFLIARFYEKQKKYDAAKIYYQSIIDQFPDTSWSTKAIERISIVEDHQSKQNK